MYESFYNLNAKPFQLSPDPRFFYSSSGHKRALAYLRYGVKQGEGFIIITGDVGTGKSTLIGALFRSIEHENVVAAQVVTTQLQANDLLRMVAAAYGLPYERVTKAGLLHHLEEYFRSCVQEGKRVLLVVDEAQGLPRGAVEELRMLSNFQYRGRALLQTFMLGQKEFRITMRSEGFEQLRQRVIAAYHLRPLNAEETRRYIEHRLRTAGWDDDPHFTDDVFPEIHRFTEGVPRRINTLCDRLMLYGLLEELHTIDRDALAAVGEDILEEQGGPWNERNLPADPPAGEALPGAEEGEGRLPDAAAESPRRKRNGGGRREAHQEKRIDQVEQSVVALTEAMREELAMLRKALVEYGRPGGDSGEQRPRSAADTTDEDDPDPSP